MAQIEVVLLGGLGGSRPGSCAREARGRAGAACRGCRPSSRSGGAAGRSRWRTCRRTGWTGAASATEPGGSGGHPGRHGAGLRRARRAGSQRRRSRGPIPRRTTTSKKRLVTDSPLALQGPAGPEREPSHRHMAMPVLTALRRFPPSPAGRPARVVDALAGAPPRQEAGRTGSKLSSGGRTVPSWPAAESTPPPQGTNAGRQARPDGGRWGWRR